MKIRWRRLIVKSWALSKVFYRLQGLRIDSKPDDRVWYFAFGANMHDSAFQEQRGMRPIEWRAGRVRGYRLRFNLEGRPRGKAAPANISPDPKAEGWGVLYQITRAGLVHLDSPEGVSGWRYRPPGTGGDGLGGAAVAGAVIPAIPPGPSRVALLQPRTGPLRRVFQKAAGEPGVTSSTIIDPGPRQGSTEDSRVWDSRLLDAEDLAEEMGCDGMLSAVQAPLGVESRRVGHIRLMSRRPSAYSKLSMELLNKVAAYVTPAVQNALEHRQAIELAHERERVVDLDARNQELERLSDAKNRFIATVSHELKTPLTSMLAFTGILHKNRHGVLGQLEIGQLDVTKRNGRRLAILYDDPPHLVRTERAHPLRKMGDFDATVLRCEVHPSF